MATKIYDTDIIYLVDGTKIYLSPLKIKYLREFMDKFQDVKKSQDDDEAIVFMLECTFITMQQYCPRIKTIEDFEDNIDLQSIYKILEIGADIKLNPESEKEVKQQVEESESSWETFDIATIEAELFLLGIWKDYDDLESSLSLPELTATLKSKRDLDYQEKKFMAAIQGIDMDEQKSQPNAWEEMKARVFSGGSASDANDIMALQGINAQKAGFGIGMGLSYEKL